MKVRFIDNIICFIYLLGPSLPKGFCSKCERQVKLTKHHLYPKETHKQMRKKGIDDFLLSQTISICRMCHSTIHRFFDNDMIANELYTLELLLNNEKYYKYARWASNQK